MKETLLLKKFVMNYKLLDKKVFSNKITILLVRNL